MNDDRMERRYDILVESFYKLKSHHMGPDAHELTPGKFDAQDLEHWMSDHGHTFDEVKAALTFVFVTESPATWATSLMNLSSFAQKYDEICDQLDGWFPVKQNTGGYLKGSTTGLANHLQSVDQAAASRAAAEQAADETPERPSDDARQMYVAPADTVKKANVVKARKALEQKKPKT